MVEQQSTWRKFFNLLDDGYSSVTTKLNLKQTALDQQQRQSLVSKFESLDMKSCWNSKVQGAFVTIDQVLSNPKIIACKVYRKIQPYISTPSKSENKEK